MGIAVVALRFESVPAFALLAAALASKVRLATGMRAANGE
jgi:hypothetical protein